MEDSAIQELLNEVRQQNRLLGNIIDILSDQSRYKEYLSTQDVGAMLGRCEETIRRWIASGKLYGFKLNEGTNKEKYLIPRTVVERLLQKNQIK